MFLLLFAGLAAVLAAVLWLVASVLQGWLDNDLPRWLPLRAILGSALVAGFLTAWCAIDRDDPGKFDTLFSFRSDKLSGTYDEFLSVRKVNDVERKPVRFVRRAETRQFEAFDTRRPWRRSDAEGMVVAILIREADQDDFTRFDAVLTPEGTFSPTAELRFETAEGRKYMEATTLGRVWYRRPMAVGLNLLANGLHYLLWVLVCWPVLRFALNHAIGLAFLFWAITMVAVQPVLLDMSRTGGLG